MFNEISPTQWLDILGLFLFMAGFVIGLGAVTVIDWHGFLARKSSYWTEATIRSHKITKPLIWTGILTAIVGGVLYYRHIGFTSVATTHTILGGMLIANGTFLSFVVSPYLIAKEKAGKAKTLLPKKWQRRITVSFLISFTGWWLSLLLLAWDLVMRGGPIY